MDKGRHPHVVRTWTVERTKTLYRPPQAARLRSKAGQDFRGPGKHPGAPPLAPHHEDKPSS